jgi:hypothetical protein
MSDQPTTKATMSEKTAPAMFEQAPMPKPIETPVAAGKPGATTTPQGVPASRAAIPILALLGAVLVAALASVSPTLALLAGIAVVALLIAALIARGVARRRMATTRKVAPDGSVTTTTRPVPPRNPFRRPPGDRPTRENSRSLFGPGGGRTPSPGSRGASSGSPGGAGSPRGRWAPSGPPGDRSRDRVPPAGGRPPTSRRTPPVGGPSRRNPSGGPSTDPSGSPQSPKDKSGSWNPFRRTPKSTTPAGGGHPSAAPAPAGSRPSRNSGGGSPSGGGQSPAGGKGKWRPWGGSSSQNSPAGSNDPGRRRDKNKQKDPSKQSRREWWFGPNRVGETPPPKGGSKPAATKKPKITPVGEATPTGDQSGANPAVSPPVEPVKRERRPWRPWRSRRKTEVAGPDSAPLTPLRQSRSQAGPSDPRCRHHSGMKRSPPKSG